jgi:hypothetical protein
VLSALDDDQVIEGVTLSPFGINVLRITGSGDMQIGR